MFKKGQAVICVDNKMGNIGPYLNQGKTYHIKEFVPPEECESLPYNEICEWDKNGGRVELEEEPGLRWSGYRFELQDNKEEK